MHNCDSGFDEPTLWTMKTSTCFMSNAQKVPLYQGPCKRGWLGAWPPLFQKTFFVCRIHTLNPKADVTLAYSQLSKSMRGPCISSGQMDCTKVPNFGTVNCLEMNYRKLNLRVNFTMSRYALFDIFVIEFYGNPSMFTDIGIFFYVRHNILYSFGLSLHFPLKLMSNHN